MRREEHKGHHHEGRHRGRRSEHNEVKTEGAKTFRRKRAIMFLEHLETKESILKKQLTTPELQSINSIIVGELKATQAIIEEFVQQFELYEFEEYAKLRFNKDPENDANEEDKK
ncbi:hypothetical protein [Ureibacillus acetophenoni]|uniref:Uncharacterized protein n=1 Tax=Ureibacillus acetophenoni TaxID=614649 RepID=A0A285ULI1_9BACL|nr:hypothetical protein [Ureibacillus acetophenoni]SOC42547.1 hypothetical protein SAMN05877842_11333 [Ureibacillus acetophenoni]